MYGRPRRLFSMTWLPTRWYWLVYRRRLDYLKPTWQLATTGKISAVWEKWNVCREAKRMQHGCWTPHFAHVSVPGKHVSVLKLHCKLLDWWQSSHISRFLNPCVCWCWLKRLWVWSFDVISAVSGVLLHIVPFTWSVMSGRHSCCDKSDCVYLTSVQIAVCSIWNATLIHTASLSLVIRPANILGAFVSGSFTDRLFQTQICQLLTGYCRCLELWYWHFGCQYTIRRFIYFCKWPCSIA